MITTMTTLTPPSEVSELLGTKPQKETSRRRRSRRRPTRITPAVVDRVATLTAGGVSTRRTAAALNLSPETVTKIKSRDEVRDLITKLRETIRETALQAISRGQRKTWDWLDDVVETRDPKAFDYVTRGLAALEKVASSASGEARRLEGIIAAYPAGSQAEARELVHRMLAESSEAESVKTQAEAEEAVLLPAP